jgi:hypothetical protein
MICFQLLKLILINIYTNIGRNQVGRFRTRILRIGKYLLNKKCSKDLNHDIITVINQLANIGDDKSLLFIRCKIYIELGKYDKALLDFNRLFELNYENISFIYLLQKYHDYWLYLCSYNKISDNDYRDIRTIENFKKYMYKG